ncbi:ethanolamine ammonia-lyase subunit EutC [Falsirhodobacter halotolerans]|uniref:ethanolamine ammonia-lyase subunit EutC n=1 Tax=Falsirhodobacter halotolerans TaxID=1146892 RepID=UPI001FD39CC3|nr:ethanolamine ammonia-lyase subunit EutC [Falsirhodobacter halotolerans]MCJ8141116.1 ethanolamine ammonia-lyase subunit EutC [Falsirhodobacter halotolerans]
MTDLVPRLSALTPSRVRLDPKGGPAPLGAVLEFQECHARARAAIHGTVDWDAFARALDRPTLRLHSRAADRAEYIRRPDLGRRLDAASEGAIDHQGCDLAIIVADGLSATAVTTQAAPLIAALTAAAPDLTLGPVALVAQGRVAVGDEVASRMGAAMGLVLIGERPGLSVSDSLGAYLTLNPIPGTPDSRRNCVSNIHGRGGLSIAEAAAKIVWLMRAARRIGATGIALKDESPSSPRLE